MQILSTDISKSASTINQLSEIEKNAASLPGVTQQDLDAFIQIKLELLQLQQKWQTIFLWQDGPLVQAMKHGDFLLVDEISLADDSVLERLNSVLEPERKLVGILSATLSTYFKLVVYPWRMHVEKIGKSTDWSIPIHVLLVFVP